MTKQALVIPVLILVAAGALLLKMRFEVQGRDGKLEELQTKVEEAERQIAILTEENQGLHEKLKAVPAQPSVIDSFAAPQVPDSQVPPLQAGVPSADRAERSALWRTRQFIGEVEEDLALTPEQKEALTEAYKTELGGTGDASEQARGELVARVLGDEAGRAYQEKRLRAEEQERSEQMNSEAIVLARKLSLTPDQETRTREALSQIERELRPKAAQVRVIMREAMANHMGGEEAKDQLKQQYDAIKQLSTEIKTASDTALFAALGPTLSDEQKNALLALQAEKR